MAGLRVFVTGELFPFTAGGIGRAIANMLDQPEVASTGEPREPRFAVVFLGEPLDRARFTERFPHVLLVDASPRTYAERDEVTGLRYAPVDFYTTHPMHAESVRAMQALKRLERERGALEYVEFADWGGAAFASVQEKRLGLAFEQATLAVRLHTSDSVLNAVEGKLVDHMSLAFYDLERKAIADCDLIIGQAPGPAAFMQRVFDFEDDEWTPRLVIDAPPVMLDRGEAANESILPTLDTPVVFSSKIQRIKRPDVFIRGCLAFLRARPDYRGQIRLIAMVDDAAYLEEVRALVPAAFAGRFEFVQGTSSEQRHRAICESVCVFPGTFESFCLAAYEASFAGAFCVLNGANPAFDSSSPWLDGHNCAKFDGSPAGLARTLSAVFAAPKTMQPVSVVPGVRPWCLKASPQHADSEEPRAPLPLVSVLVPHFNLGVYLAETVDNALASDYPNLEVIVVDDASTDEHSLEAVRRLEQRNDPRIRVVRSPQNRGLAGTRNVAVEHARGEFALTLDADDLIDHRFVGVAAATLAKHADVSFVVPQTAYFDDEPGARPQQDDWSLCITFIGEARSSGFVQNRFSTATLMSRMEVLRSMRYNETLSAFEDWDLYLRSIMMRKRFVVTNAVHFYYRHRRNSMIHSEAATRRIGLYYHDIVRDKQIAFGRIRLPMFVLEGINGGLQGESVSSLRARLALYENSPTVRAALALRAQLDRLPGWTRGLLKWLGGRIRQARSA
ncbi:glycosyltransferase family 2 protein [Paraburkholderia sp. J63]|uniref:glycosyltransferase family 2 protein n=1 Tax=Paraburkholderia sp. J63 TaxID=2805434 RepID=UPI002ABE62FD|nr:glycosyltransferase [Paraburkholderia sp. J63]